VITHDHIRAMKHNAIVCNIGHFDSEIDIASLAKYRWEEIKPQVDHVIFRTAKARDRPCQRPTRDLAAAPGIRRS